MACKSVEALQKEINELKARVDAHEEYITEQKERIENSPDGDVIEEFVFLAKDRVTPLATTSELSDTFLASVGLALLLNEVERDEAKIYTPFETLAEMKKECKQKEVEVFGRVID